MKQKQHLKLGGKGLSYCGVRPGITNEMALYVRDCSCIHCLESYKMRKVKDIETAAKKIFQADRRLVQLRTKGED